MNSAWQVTPEVKLLPTLHNPVLLEGLPGIGNVGKIAVDFLIEEFRAEKLYSFFSYKFPYSVFVNEHNLVEMPQLALYYKKFNGKRKGSSAPRDLLLLTGDIQPIDEESCYLFCEEVIKIAKQFKCSEIITTGGIGLQTVPEKPRVYVTANTSRIFNDYTRPHLRVEAETFGVVGPIVGVSGILLGLSQRYKEEAVALLAETFGHPMYLGIKGAKEILRVLEAKFSWNINLHKMSREIIELEKEIIKKTADWASETAHPAAAGARTKKIDAGYIG